MHAGRRGVPATATSTLDPTRSILAATYSWNYHQQTETTLQRRRRGCSSFQGVDRSRSATIADFGRRAGAAPAVAAGVGAEALLLRRTRRPCAAERPGVPARRRRVQELGLRVEHARARAAVVAAHDERGADAHDRRRRTARSSRWRAAITCARRSNERLGFADVCGLDAVDDAEAPQTTVAQIVAGLPSDGYGRGAPMPGAAERADAVLPRRHREHLRRRSRRLVIDARGRPQAAEREGTGRATTPDAAIARLRRDGDGAGAVRPARRAPRPTLLNAHFTTRDGAGRQRDGRAASRRSSSRAWRRRRSRSGCEGGADDHSPRSLMLARCSAPGYVGLRALATGLPASFLLNPRARAGRRRRPRCARRQGAVHHPHHVGQRRSDQRQRARDVRRSRPSSTARTRRWRRRR